MRTTGTISSGWRCRLAAWLLPLLVAACGGGGGDSAPAGGGTGTGTGTGSATIGAAGGQLSGTDGVRLTVPAGALGNDLTLRIARDTTGMNPALAAATPDADKAIVASPTYALTPHGTQFSEPAELRIPIDRSVSTAGGVLVALRTDPGRDGWDLVPLRAIENGEAVVPIGGFSYYKLVVIKQLPQTPPGPPVIDMSMTLGGQAPQNFKISPTSPGNWRRLYGSIGNRSDSLRLAGRITGLPAACNDIVLAGRAQTTQEPTATDVNGGAYGGGDSIGLPVFARQAAKVDTDTSGATPRPTLDFAFDLNIDNAPFKREVFEALRAGNVTGPTPPVGLSFNAYARCTSPVDLGGGFALNNFMVMPGATQEVNPVSGATYFNFQMWAWATVLFTTDYVPQGFISHPSDVTVAAGASASFSTSAWPTPVGEQRLEWWRSNNDGGSWTRVRTSIVPVSDTADTYTLPSVAVTDHNALFRARLCTVPRQAGVAESCDDGIAARLSVVQGAVAASFVQQPRALLVRSGQTASLSVQAAGVPVPSLRWQSRPANSAGAWADVAGGSGAASANYTTLPLSVADNGLQLRAVATNPVGEAASVPVTVSVSDVDVAPTLQSQPAALSVVAGSEAVFAVVARGTEALSYQWRRDGQPIAGANAPVLKLAAVSSADASGYSVLVSNAAGSVTSESATLSVNPGAAAAVAPTIVTQPVSVLTHVGNTATFGVGVSGTGPLSYQWLKAGQPIAGANAATYSVAIATLADDGSYAVRVSNAAGSVTSWNVVLTVNEAAQPQTLAITTQPSPQVQLPGGSATFAVAASGSGPIGYQWLKNGTPIAGATGAVLALAGITGGDAGSYAVTLSNSLGSVTSSAAALTVVGAPLIATQPAAASVSEGQAATFSVSASGNGLRYQWTLNGVAIVGATAGSYTTPATTPADNGGVYGVLVYNGAGIVFSQGAVLSVAAAPPVWPEDKIAAGLNHTCAIARSGALYCWGNGSSGEIGDGATTFRAVPTRVSGLSTFKTVAAGSWDSCAIDSADALWCWGSMGDWVPAPLFAAVGVRVRAVSLGSDHGCYVDDSRQVFCWGNTTFGKRGDLNPTGDAPTAVRRADDSLLRDAVAVAVGINHSCAQLADGSVWCWGADVAYGIHDTATRVMRRLPDGSRMDFTATGRLVAGRYHTCAIESGSGQPMCWGANSEGQLGDGSTVSRDDAMPAGLFGALSLTAGAGHSCAVRANDMLCWGTAYLGNGGARQTLLSPTTTGRVGAYTDSPDPLSAAAAGERHTCVLRRSGDVQCWGWNNAGQIGNNALTVDALTPASTAAGAVFWTP
jgi:alpha-tubulin suppressor-like RCC1 family protein